jgi:hypothetical protein
MYKFCIAYQDAIILVTRAYKLVIWSCTKVVFFIPFLVSYTTRSSKVHSRI